LLDVDEAVPLTKKKIIYGQQIDVSIAMIRLFGGEGIVYQANSA
jgi:hypothetical protein